MKRSFLAKVKVAGILAATTATVTLGNAAVIPKAGADPTFTSSYVGVGSDTIQDVMDAFSGANPYPPSGVTQFYTPLHSSAASGNKTVSSFDAVPAGGSASNPGCVIPKLGGPNIDRPNGSGNGIHALSRAVDGAGWQASVASCTGGTTNPTPSVTGQIDFARSSRGPNNTTTSVLTYIPFARDALSYAFFDHGTGTIATLTSAQLHSLYTSPTGSITVGTDTVLACISQSGSGTTAFWETAIGVTAAQAGAASAASGCTANPSLLEENGANSFFTFAGGLAAGTDAVVDFSAASWIAQANGTALDRSATARAGGVDMGAIDALGKPYTGVAPNEAPSSTFYASTTYGRDVYVVVSTARIGTFGDAGLKSLFVGPSSAICAAGPQGTRALFGFQASVLACGSTTLTGALDS